MGVADPSIFDPIGTQIAFLLFVLLVGIGAVLLFAVMALELPFAKLSEALHPRQQDALRNGEHRRARRLEVAENAINKLGEAVVGIVFVALFVAVPAAGAVAIFGWQAVVLVVGFLAVVGTLGSIAQRYGLLEP